MVRIGKRGVVELGLRRDTICGGRGRAVARGTLDVAPWASVWEVELGQHKRAAPRYVVAVGLCVIIAWLM